VLTNLVSRAIAKDYSQQFGLTIPEWRVMAVLGRHPGLSANQVADHAAMDKVTVSRAVARLVRNGRLLRKTDRTDRRRSSLRLSASGHRIYQIIMPRALSHETALVAGLDQNELRCLDRLLSKLTESAVSLKD
jgi:DNA-binding MarR family transcriptional regulator